MYQSSDGSCSSSARGRGSVAGQSGWGLWTFLESPGIFTYLHIVLRTVTQYLETSSMRPVNKNQIVEMTPSGPEVGGVSTDLPKTVPTHELMSDYPL